MSTALTALLKAWDENPVLLLCSGGSALALLNDISQEAVGPDVTLGLLDERFDHNFEHTNASALRTTAFFARAMRASVHVLDIDIRDDDTLVSYTARFEGELRGWRARYPQGRIIITQGVGADGHTAGIMPFPEDPARFQKLFEDPDHWVVGYDAGEKNRFPLRVTVTLPFLRHEVDGAVVYAVGEEKKEAIERVQALEGTLAETPARIIHEMRRARIFFNG